MRAAKLAHVAAITLALSLALLASADEPTAPSAKQEATNLSSRQQEASFVATSKSLDVRQSISSSQELHQSRPKSAKQPNQSKRSRSSSSSSNNNEADVAATKQALESCNYDRGAWQECQPNGIQQRVLRLSAKQTIANATKCEPYRLVRRECQLGCKYLRGDWSAGCKNGLRLRVDTLIGVQAPPTGDAAPRGATGRRRKFAKAASCPSRRQVTKDCKRACHYVKSAWSECSNGYRTRTLSLEELAPDQLQSDISANSKGLLNWPTNRANCAPSKTVRRECKPALDGRPAPLGATASAAAAELDNQTPEATNSSSPTTTRRPKLTRKKAPKEASRTPSAPSSSANKET